MLTRTFVCLPAVIVLGAHCSALQKKIIEAFPGKIDTCLTYCHYSMNDYSLVNYLPWLKEQRLGVINGAAISMSVFDIFPCSIGSRQFHISVTTSHASSVMELCYHRPWLGDAGDGAFGFLQKHFCICN